MKYILMLDTSVWLDLAADPFGDEILTQIERLVASGCVTILKIDVIDQEFDRHKDDHAKRLASSIRTRIKDLKRFAKEFGSEQVATGVAAAMDGFGKELGTIENAAEKRLARIASLLHGATAAQVSQGIKERTTQRGLKKLAPFHSHKNSVADSLIIEAFGEVAKQTTDANQSFVFLTSNVNDFCDPQDHRKPHPDLAGLFGTNTAFSINIADSVKTIGESLKERHQITESHISNDAIEHVQWMVEQKSKCPLCGQGSLVDQGWIRTGYGMSWHLRCTSCGRMFDTGELWD